MKTGRQAGRQEERQSDKQRDRQACGRETHGHANTQTYR